MKSAGCLYFNPLPAPRPATYNPQRDVEYLVTLFYHHCATFHHVSEIQMKYFSTDHLCALVSFHPTIIDKRSLRLPKCYIF